MIFIGLYDIYLLCSFLVVLVSIHMAMITLILAFPILNTFIKQKQLEYKKLNVVAPPLWRPWAAAQSALS